MPKKTVEEIQRFYSIKNVVDTYDERRFVGRGGRYVSGRELGVIINALKDVSTKTNLSVLDLGAGRGRLSLVMNKFGYDVYCLDASQEMVGMLKKYFPQSRIFHQSAFSPIKTGKRFGVITSLRFFDHFDIGDHRKILKNLLPALRRRGLFIYATLNRNSLEYVFSNFLYFGKSNFYYRDFEYRRLFKGLGFEVLGRKSAFFLPRGIFIHSQKVPWLYKLLIYFNSFLENLFPSYNSLYCYTLKKK